MTTETVAGRSVRNGWTTPLEVRLRVILGNR